MNATIIERTLGAPAGKPVTVSPTLCIVNDGPGHNCIDLVDPDRGVADKNRLMVVLDHDIPAGSFDSAAVQKRLIDFAAKNDLEFVQSAGIGYQILTETRVQTGDIIVSPGTHNSFVGAKGGIGLNLDEAAMGSVLASGRFELEVPATAYVELTGRLSPGVSAIDLVMTLLKGIGSRGFEGLAVEIVGSALADLSLNDRIVLCSMMQQTSAVCAMISDCKPSRPTRTCDLGSIVPMVAPPGSLFEAKPAGVFSGIAMHAGFVGGCMGGRIEDLRTAAAILKGRRVKVGVRLLFGTASNAVYLQAADEGLIDVILDSGAQVTNPGCASCRTTSIGVVGDNEVLLTTGSYNYPGCAGTTDSKVYIASAATVVNASLTGVIAA